MAPAWSLQPNLRRASGTGGTSSVGSPNSNPRAARKRRASGSKPDGPEPRTARNQLPADQVSGPPPHRWTFLTNHAHVLIVLRANPDMVLREVAGRVGITERAVQRIVQDLEEEGFIRRQKIGRKNRYEVLSDKPLRHPLEAHRNIGDLLGLITG